MKGSHYNVGATTHKIFSVVKNELDLEPVPTENGMATAAVREDLVTLLAVPHIRQLVFDEF
jgi:hypothetical protein